MEHILTGTRRESNMYVLHINLLLALITSTVSLIPLMVTRLLLSLRRASDPETIAQWNTGHFTGPRTLTTVTTPGDHSNASNGQNFTTMRVSQSETLDSVFELSDFGSKDKGHPGGLDGEA